MNMKKIIAAVLSLCMLGGTLPYKAAKDITHAQGTTLLDIYEGDCYTYDAKSHTLSLFGEINADSLRNFKFKDEVTFIESVDKVTLPTDCSGLFEGYSNCKKILLYKFNYDTRVTNTSSMFKDCTALESLVFGLYPYLDTMFWDNKDASYMFDGCKNLSSVSGIFNKDIYGADMVHFSTVTNVSCMFRGCSKLKNIRIQLPDNPDSPIDASSMFEGCSSIENIEFDKPDFVESCLSNMSKMFSGCNNLHTLPNVDILNTSAVTDMSYMFYMCSSLKDANFSSFETSNVTDMKYMFCGCTALEELNVDCFDTSKVTDMTGMFASCFNLAGFNLKNFDTSNVTSMAFMFMESGFKELDLSSFNTPKLKHTEQMFGNCFELRRLDLRKFDTTNIDPANMKEMFINCDKLQLFTIDKFHTIYTDMKLYNSSGWASASQPTKKLGNDDEFFSIVNDGLTTYRTMENVPRILTQPPSEVYFDDYGTAHIPIEVEGKNCIIQWYVKNNTESDFGLYDDDYLYNQDGKFIWPGYLDFANNDGKGLSYALFDGAEMYFLVKSLDDGISVKSDIVKLKRRYSDVDRNATVILPQAGQTLSEYTSQEDFVTMKELIFDKDAFHISYKDKNNKYQTMKPTDTFIADVDYTFFIKAYLPPHIFPSEIYTFINKGLIVNGIENPPDEIYDEKELYMANLWVTKPDYKVLIGDINCDKSISIADAVLLQRYILEPNRTIIPNWHNADINKDNVVDVFDLIILKQNCLNQK